MSYYCTVSSTFTLHTWSLWIWTVLYESTRNCQDWQRLTRAHPLEISISFNENVKPWLRKCQTALHMYLGMWTTILSTFLTLTACLSWGLPYCANNALLQERAVKFYYTHKIHKKPFQFHTMISQYLTEGQVMYHLVSPLITAIQSSWVRAKLCAQGAVSCWEYSRF